MTPVNFFQIGPVVLPARLNGENYLNFSREELPPLLDELGLPEEIRNNLIFMQDGAPPHHAGIVRDFLDETYPHGWIGRDGPIAWPPRLPDLNPLDYFLWGHLKDIVYQQSVDDRDVALGLIQDAAAGITREMLERSTRGIKRRLHDCVNRNGEHFEQLL